jgi:hypothetical protein
MSTRTREETLRSLELPDPFEDMTGIISGELKVIVRALSDRGGERLLLSHRQVHELKRTLWNRLTEVINEVMEPLTVERH